MPGPAVSYRLDNLSRGVVGLGRNLTPAEADSNIWALAQAIVMLQTDRPQPNNIARVDIVGGTSMNIILTDGTVLGPLPLPVLSWAWRKAWLPFTAYATLDVFTVEGVGIYYTLEPHTTGATFNPGLLVAGLPAYSLIFAFDGMAFDPIYDIGFYYPGLISDVTATYIYQEYLLREITIPITADQHNAYLQEPPSTQRQVFSIFHNDTLIGSITFEIGANVGVVVFSVAVDILRRERLSVGKPPLADASAAGLSVAFAAQRVL